MLVKLSIIENNVTLHSTFYALNTNRGLWPHVCDTMGYGCPYVNFGILNRLELNAQIPWTRIRKLHGLLVLLYT